MGWRDRAAGHAVLDEVDFTKLDQLPKVVAFQVWEFSHKKQKVWFIGTRSNVKKWGKDDDPFVEFSPDGSAKFVQRVAETAASFCKAFDELHAFAKAKLPGSQFTGFGPCKKVGELSLGLQIATLLGTRVFSFIDDDDPVQAVLACVCEPDRVLRARCEKITAHLLYENGVTTVFVGKFYSSSGVADPDADLVNRLAKIPDVRKGKLPKDYPFGHSKELVSKELNDFVGAEIAEADTVVPNYANMKVLLQRASGGKLKAFK